MGTIIMENRGFGMRADVTVTVILEGLPSVDLLMQAAKSAEACVSKYMDQLWGGGLVEYIVEDGTTSSIYHIHLAKNKKKLYVQYIGDHISVEDMQ